MGKIALGAEVYTWFMSEEGKTYQNQLGHMIEIVAKAGFTGIEPMFFWMGDWADPVRLGEKLDEHRVELAGLALAVDWNHPKETDDERKMADDAINLLKHFLTRYSVPCRCQPVGKISYSGALTWWPMSMKFRDGQPMPASNALFIPILLKLPPIAPLKITMSY